MEQPDSCNMHINELADAAGLGADEAVAKQLLLTQLLYPMASAWALRNALLTCVERSHRRFNRNGSMCRGFDGFVAIGGCDKNMPGCAMAVNRQQAQRFVYGGTIQPGKNRRDVVSVFEAVGQHAAGKISDIELKEVESTAILGRILRRHVHC